MILKLCNFLSSKKMTLVSFLFLLLSGILMILKIDFPFNFAWVTIIISGLPIFYWGLTIFFKKKKMTASLLITIAMTAAILSNEIFAAAEVAFIMAFGGILEDMTIDKAKEGISKILTLAPKIARKLLEDSVNSKEIPACEVKKGDIIRVLAGENIPVDGVIRSGESAVNQAIMTGESVPVDKKEGDFVFSGTTNCSNTIDIEVTKEYQDSSIQKLINLIKEAGNKKAPTERIVDKWAQILIPFAILFSVIVYFATGEISRAVTVLVVFCPCSLVLATPISIVAAIGQAAKKGVIVKNGEALETIGKCGVFAFDKTGTLTLGKLEVTDVEAFLGESPDEILYLCASSEVKSEHPIAKAIVDHALKRDFKLNETSDFKVFSGKGIYAKLYDKKILVGNEKFLLDNDTFIGDDLKQSVNSKRLQGKVVLIVAYNNTAYGIIALSDKIKETSTELIKDLNKDSKTLLLTGDNALTAEHFAKKTGINEAISNLLPKEKADTIESLQKEGNLVAMTGDGVNDALALKAANVGISMGTFGSDIAIESSDIIVTGDDLLKIGYLRKLSKACIKTITANITFSMMINFVSLTCSAMGILNPLTGAIVHNIASILVVSNAYLLYKRKI